MNPVIDSTLFVHLASCLRVVEFPASSGDLLAYAQELEAPRELIALIAGLPCEDLYGDAHEVLERCAPALSKVERLELLREAELVKTGTLARFAQRSHTGISLLSVTRL